MQFASPLWNFDPLHSLWGLRCISRRIQFHSYNNSTGSTRFGWNTDGDTNLDFLCFRQIILIGAIIHPVITTLNLPSLYSFAAYTASNTLPSLSQPNGSCGSATLASGDGVDVPCVGVASTLGCSVTPQAATIASTSNKLAK